MTKERYYCFLQQFGCTKLQGYYAEERKITLNNHVWYISTDTSRRQKYYGRKSIMGAEVRDGRGYDSKELTAARWQQ